MATHIFACSWATTLVDVSSASHCTSTNSTFSVKGISKCPVFLQFYLLPTSVTFIKLENGDLFFSCRFIHFHEMRSNCRHILQTRSCATPPSCFSFNDTECLPAAHLSCSFVDLVTGSLQYVGYPKSSFPIYDYKWHNTTHNSCNLLLCKGHTTTPDK